MILESFDFYQLNQLSVKELKALVEEEKKGVEELRGQIKSKMLRISAAMKRYDISTGNVNAHIKFEEGSNVKTQLIQKLMNARQYRMKLQMQYNQIKDVGALDILQRVITGFDNVEVSKQVEILRNLGYSEDEIDIILAEISGDEDYDELKEKAQDILANYYEQQGETTENIDDVTGNPYAL